MTEQDCIQQAQSGDRDALESLIAGRYQAVFANFYRNTGRYHQSKDLTQETFIKMVSALGRYRPKASFKSWLFAIASNHLKNYYRTMSRRPERPGLVETFSVDEPALHAAETKSDIRQALSSLPAEQREAVVLRFYHDFSIREISKITGAGQPAVKARIRYGLAKLEKQLEGYHENE